MTTLREYRINLGWSQNEMAKAAGISPAIVKKAEDGRSIEARTAKLLADAITRATGQTVKPVNIEGLNIL